MVKEKEIQKELIDQLEEDRDYGKRTYKDVVKDVKGGALIIAEGKTLPVLKDATTGVTVSGTGAPLKKNAQKSWQMQFNERAVSDFDAVYGSLVKAAVEKSDVKAAMYFMDRVLGSPAKLQQMDDFDQYKKTLARWGNHRHGSLLDSETERLELIKGSKGAYLDWQYMHGYDLLWDKHGINFMEKGYFEVPDDFDWDSAAGQDVIKHEREFGDSSYHQKHSRNGIKTYLH